jgi:hypothetical protein
MFFIYTCKLIPKWKEEQKAGYAFRVYNIPDTSGEANFLSRLLEK